MDIEQHWTYGAMNPNQDFYGIRIGGGGFNLFPSNRENIVFVKVYNRQYHVINALGSDEKFSLYPVRIRQLKLKLQELERVLKHYNGNICLFHQCRCS